MSGVAKLDDNALLRAALENDQPAWREMVRRFDALMYEVAHEATSAAGGDEATVDGVLAETWLALPDDRMRRFRRYDPARGVPLPGWLALQATRAATKYLRQRARQPELLSLDDVDEIPDPRTIDPGEPRSLKSHAQRPTPLGSIDAAIRETVSEVVREVVREEVRSVLREERPAARGEGDEQYLAINEAAKIARLHHTTIREWIKDGSLPASRVGRVYRIRRRDLEARLSPKSAPQGPRSVEEQVAAILAAKSARRAA